MDLGLMAGPLWRPEAAMRLLWRDWRQALPASGTAWVVRRVLRASCVYDVVAERRFTFANTWFLLGVGAECATSAEDLSALVACSAPSVQWSTTIKKESQRDR